MITDENAADAFEAFRLHFFAHKQRNRRCKWDYVNQRREPESRGSGLCGIDIFLQKREKTLKSRA